MTWHQVWQDIMTDISCLYDSRPGLVKTSYMLLTNRGTQALAAYRVAHILWLKHVPLIPDMLTRLIQVLYAIDIAYEADIAPGCIIYHGMGLVIGSRVKIGRGAVLYHGVTLGVLSFGPLFAHRAVGHTFSHTRDGLPTIGDYVLIGAGAKILGNITIGDYAVIGANAVVTSSIPAGHSATGNPAMIRPRAGVDHLLSTTASSTEATGASS